MVRAVAEDFARTGDFTVSVLQDQRIELALPAKVNATFVDSKASEHKEFRVALQSNDVALIIAPEIGQHLATRVEMAETIGARLLSPNTEFVQLASNKRELALHLLDRGIQTPPVDFTGYPRIVKPVHGCGSIDVALRTGESESTAIEKSFISQPIVEGQPASVALLCGSTAHFALPPMRQLIAANDFSYLGGESIESPSIANRALRIATSALQAMPPACGYVGVDLILGSEKDGSQDFVIEVNPRLTTSYVGLRELSDVNLAAAMTSIALGKPVDLTFRDASIRFDPSGIVSSR